jgi:hypothetical protein
MPNSANQIAYPAATTPISVSAAAAGSAER